MDLNWLDPSTDQRRLPQYRRLRALNIAELPTAAKEQTAILFRHECDPISPGDIPRIDSVTVALGTTFVHSLL